MVEDLSKDERIGFHKGALTTLAKERQEISRILQIVEQLMRMHIQALEELGVDITKVSEKKPIEDLVDERK
ncbi:MAG: hypothetical protein QXG86_01695 [Candidatus Woesearchaeota archaeon]